VGQGAGNIIFRKLGGPVERYTPLVARVRARREAFCFWTIFYFGGCSEAAMGGGARSAPFGVAMSPKDRCAQRTGAHARQKPTSLSYIYLGSSVCHPVCHPVFRPVCRPVVVAER
jgi:hypothetical protein